MPAFRDRWVSLPPTGEWDTIVDQPDSTPSSPPFLSLVAYPSDVLITSLVFTVGRGLVFQDSWVSPPPSGTREPVQRGVWPSAGDALRLARITSTLPVLEGAILKSPPHNLYWNLPKYCMGASTNVRGNPQGKHMSLGL